MKFIESTLIIPTYERPDSLKCTLDSCFSCDFIPSQIIIVDQSSPEIYEKICSFISEDPKFNNVEIIRSEKVGITAARNYGLKYAKNDIVIFSDDDVLFEKNTFSNTFKLMSDSDIFLIGGLDLRTMNKKRNCLKTLALSFFFLDSFKKRNVGRVLPSIFGKYPSKVDCMVSTEWAMGYYFSIKKSYAEEKNIFFDENLSKYSYAEDLDFTYRYFKACSSENKKCILSPDVAVIHCCSQEYRSKGKEHLKKIFINRHYLCKKFFGEKKTALVKLKISNQIYKFLLRRTENKKVIREAYKEYLKEISAFLQKYTY